MAILKFLSLLIKCDWNVIDRFPMCMYSRVGREKLFFLFRQCNSARKLQFDIINKENIINKF